MDKTYRVTISGDDIVATLEETVVFLKTLLEVYTPIHGIWISEDEDINDEVVTSMLIKLPSPMRLVGSETISVKELNPNDRNKVCLR